MSECQRSFEYKITWWFTIGFIACLAGWLVSAIVWRAWLPDSDLWNKICDTFGILTGIGFFSLLCVADLPTDEEDSETEKQTP